MRGEDTDQGEGHGDHAEAEVGEGEVADEDVPGGPHLRGPHDGRQHQDVPETPDCNSDFY